MVQPQRDQGLFETSVQDIRVDDSRAHCESDECELIHCVVPDSVQHMQRALNQWNPEGPIQPNANLIDSGEGVDLTVN